MKLGRKTWRLLPWLLALGGLWIPALAGGFVRSQAPDSGACLHWGKRSVPWTMNERGLPSLGFERSHAAFARAFRTWQSAPCTDLVFSDRGSSAETRVGHAPGDRADNLMIFRLQDCADAVPAGASCLGMGTCANEFDCWDHGNTVIAVTTTTFYRQSGEIVDADIEMNAAWFDFTDGDGPVCVGPPVGNCVSTDIQNTATHEVGHLLGLDHTPLPSAVMFASAPKGETSKRHLTQDDVDGVCTIYPAGRATPVCGDRGRGGSGCGCQGGQGGLEGLAFAAVALGLWRLRYCA